MFLALALLLIQHATFLAYLIDSQFLATYASQDMRSMMFFIGLFSILLSIPTITWNHSMMKYSFKAKDYVGFVLSIIALVFGIVIFCFWYVFGVRLVGGRVF